MGGIGTVKNKAQRGIVKGAKLAFKGLKKTGSFIIDAVKEQYPETKAHLQIKKGQIQSKRGKLDQDDIQKMNAHRANVAEKYVEKVKNNKTFEMPALQDFMSKDYQVKLDKVKLDKINLTDIKGNKELFTKAVLEIKELIDKPDSIDKLDSQFSQRALTYIKSACGEVTDDKMMGFKQAIVKEVFGEKKDDIAGKLGEVLQKKFDKKKEDLEAKAENSLLRKGANMLSRLSDSSLQKKLDSVDPNSGNLEATLKTDRARVDAANTTAAAAVEHKVDEASGEIKRD